MKTATEEKFATLIKQTFHDPLKLQGFKKRANNFYKQEEEFGKAINIQKSTYYTKQHIHFTANIGIFLPEYHKAFFNSDLPDFPLEGYCVTSQRLGMLVNTYDTWWDVTEDTKIELLITEFNDIIGNKIIPYLSQFKTKQDVIELIKQKQKIQHRIAPLIVLSENNMIDEARKEYETLLAENTSPDSQQFVRKWATKYGLV